MIQYIYNLFFRRCTHENIRCIHGDEIVLAGYRRSCCEDCGTIFDSLPEYCSYTLKKHQTPK